MTRPIGDWVLLACGFLPLTVIAGLAYWLVPEFETVFQGFHASTGMSSQLLLASYRAWALIPVLYAVLALFAPARRSVATVFAVTGAVLSGLMAIILVHGGYAPIFAMAQ